MVLRPETGDDNRESYKETTTSQKRRDTSLECEETKITVGEKVPDQVVG